MYNSVFNQLMGKKPVFPIVAIVLFFLLGSNSAFSQITVCPGGGCDHTSIQAAVDNATSGQSINVSDGTYNERVVIDKTVTISGESESGTIVDGSGFPNGRGIAIASGVTDVTIENLTVQNFSGNNGNVHAGIYGIGGNNNLTIQNVTIQDNVGGSGFYANGPVTDVLLDYVTSSGHTSAARGIVIWNGLKSNITISNCEVFNNNCCGIELQDGTSTGVTFINNNVYNNGDNGIGIVGMEGPGENVVSGNILSDNGRFGIEIKNPNGSGATSGPGSIVVENNQVSLTSPIGDVRDLLGIGVFRRGVLAGNVDVPSGVIVQNNTVSGYVQASNSDGFGIVAEGINHTVINNTLNGNDVGVQRQAGHTPYPGDGDQSNLNDEYFGRGNSPISCGIEVNGNNFSANGIDTRDVGSVGGDGFVQNMTSGEIFCTIQSAVDDANDNDEIQVAPGTYNEAVSLSTNGISLIGTGSGFTIEGPVGLTGLWILADDITLQNFTVTNFSRGMQFGNCNNIDIENCHFDNNGNSGLWVDPEYAITNLTVSNSSFDNNQFGWQINNTVSGNPNTFDGIDVSNTTFNNNSKKGLYIEKLSNAIFDGIEVDNSGTNPSWNWNNGIDINLKWGSYSNITIQNSSITNSGVQGALTHPENPAAVTIKARDDGGTYGATPASLDGVTFINNFVSGPENGVRFGEFNTGTNTGPTNDSPTNITFENNHLGGSFNHKALINNVSFPLDASCNWWGSTDAVDISAALQGDITFEPFLNAGGDSGSLAPGFSPTAACDGCSGNTVTNTTQSTVHCSIQEAIDAAGPGDVIEVEEGIYEEMLEIDKSITLIGPNDDKTGYAIDRVSEAVIQFPAGLANGVYSLATIDAEDVSIRGFTFNDNVSGGFIYDGTWPPPMLVGGVLSNESNTLVENNRFSGFNYIAVRMTQENAASVGTTIAKVGNTTSYNYFEGGTVYHPVYYQGSGGVIEHNHFVNVNAGVQIQPYRTNATGAVSNNEISSYGSALYYNYANWTIDDNALWSFSSNLITAPPVAPIWEELVWDAVPRAFQGIRVETYLQNTSPPNFEPKAVFEDNTINGDGATSSGGWLAVHGMYFRNVQGDEATNVQNITFSNNTISNVEVGVQFDDEGTDVEYDLAELYGSGNTYPAGMSILEPYQIGFAPIVNSTQNLGYFTIQEAIDDANPDDEITVASGSYDENLVINTALTLSGANAGLACSDWSETPTILAPSSGLPISVTADGVTIDGFEITNPDYQNAIVCGNTSNLSIVNNNIHNIGDNLTSSNVHAIQYTVANASNTSDVHVSDNCFSNISSSGLTGFSASAIGILQSTSTGELNGLTIERNTINQVNVNTGAWPTGKIAYGIQINVGGNNNFLTNGKVVNAQINYNTITGLEGFISTGIGLEGNTENAVVANNDISDLIGYKTANRAGGGYDLSALKFEKNQFVATVTVENNSFQTNTFTHDGTTGRGYAVSNYVTVDDGGAAALDCNWFGTATGSEIEDNPSLDGKILNKDDCETYFEPFLVASTDANPGNIGFDPASSCNGCVGNLITNVTQSTTHCSIQGAIDEANPGDEIQVPAGIYAEHISIDKSIDLRGPNYGISPNSGSRIAEAIIVPATSSVWGAIISVDAVDVSINGFILDGDNPNLTSGYTSTTSADIDAAEGVNAYYGGTENLQVNKNIIRNLNYVGVAIYPYYNGPGTPSSGNEVIDNLFEDLGTYDTNTGAEFWGMGVLLYNNAYAKVEDNVMTNVRGGVQTGNFSQATPDAGFDHGIRNNDITTRRRGIFHNLAYSSASLIPVQNNNIVGLDHAEEVEWDGILISSMSVATDVSDNTIDIGTSTKPSQGIEMWNTAVAVPVEVNGGSVTGVDIGIFLNNYEGYNSDGSDGAHANIQGVDIDAVVGVRLLDSPNSTTNGSIDANIIGCAINASDDGVVIEESVAGTVSATINENSITGWSADAVNSGVSNTIAATCNWYGTTDSLTIADGIQGDVTFTPFLQSGIDLAPSSFGFDPAGPCGGYASFVYETTNDTLVESCNTVTVQVNLVTSEAITNAELQLSFNTTELELESAVAAHPLGPLYPFGSVITSTPGIIQYAVNTLGGYTPSGTDTIPYLTLTFRGVQTSSPVVALVEPVTEGVGATQIVNFFGFDEFGLPVSLDVMSGAETLAVTVSPDTTAPGIIGTIAETTIEACLATDVPAAATSVAALEALGLDISDSCTADGDLVVTSVDVAVGTCPIVVTRTYTVTDVAGNFTTTDQVINVADNTAPVIDCQSDPGTLYTNSGVLYSVNGAEFDPTVSDDCGSFTVSHDAVATGGIIAGADNVSLAGWEFPVGGPYTITFTAEDACGNSSDCSITFSVAPQDLDVTAIINMACNEGAAVRIQLYPVGSVLNGDVVATFDATLDVSGQFTQSLTGVPSGFYDVVIKVERYLAKKVSNVDFTSGINSPSVSITSVIPGDIAGAGFADNLVGATDLSLLIFHYNTLLGGSNYNSRCDLNCDDKVDALDLSFLSFFYNTVGETPWNN